MHYFESHILQNRTTHEQVLAILLQIFDSYLRLTIIVYVH